MSARGGANELINNSFLTKNSHSPPLANETPPRKPQVPRISARSGTGIPRFAMVRPEVALHGASTDCLDTANSRASRAVDGIAVVINFDPATANSWPIELMEAK
jgi:hypothetical protein